MEEFLNPDETVDLESEEHWESETQDSSSATNKDILDDQELHFLRNNDESNTVPANTIPPTIPTPTKPSES